MVKDINRFGIKPLLVQIEGLDTQGADLHECYRWKLAFLGRLRFGTLGGFKSERGAPSSRNGGRHQIGRPGRLRSEFAHELRKALCKAGWTLQDTGPEIRLIFPGASASIIDAVIGDENEQEEAEPAQTSFGLEYQLRDFIASNISKIDVQGKHLKLFVNSEGREGIEYPTAVGPIDILAVDSTGAFYVFELKSARSPVHAIGQLARYMGWVHQTIGKDHKVHGIIVAKEIGKALRYAVSIFPNVSLFEYEIEFNLKEAHEIPGLLT